MGGAAPTPTGKGGKKPLDAAINLVPFIDLLSCCISFLLITAVWSQLAIIEAHGGGHGRGEVTVPADERVRLTLYIDGSGYTLARSTGASQAIPRKSDQYDFTR